MTEEQKEAIQNFFKSLKVLKRMGIVRSDVVLGDIGEFLCTFAFPGLQLMTEKTNEGYDAYFNNKKVQIKYSNSRDAKNIDLGKPDKYQELIIVLGKNSAHRMAGELDVDYVFYRYSSSEVIENFKVASGYKLSKTKHFKKAEKRYKINA
ncbi:hypothetical protein CYQ88_09280 [Hydrogenovibrio sp. SC-1]|uniref:hypothetical protein n=1 Tax=Hydrogenovibrio sp. SC-1 TaxID=2065820 RepID=UPI000C7A5591|nr:hypothetical protein [Hydrogenovibrio sp. SC-1]PLA73803.1 hypothetical protein CYQ88_09280 [Hydrogenovibrio sp. SC-1]